MIKHRFFKVSISFLYFNIYSDTQVFAIKNNAILILLSLWYSLVSLLLGWWGFNIRKPFSNFSNTITAISINLGGGIDYSKEADENKWDYKTNYVWNNLLSETVAQITKERLEIIIEIQEEYEGSKTSKYSEENIDFISLNLGRVDIHSVTRNEIKDVFDAFKSYERNMIDEDLA